MAKLKTSTCTRTWTSNDFNMSSITWTTTVSPSSSQSLREHHRQAPQPQSRSGYDRSYRNNKWLRMHLDPILLIGAPKHWCTRSDLLHLPALPLHFTDTTALLLVSLRWVGERKRERGRDERLGRDQGRWGLRSHLGCPTLLSESMPAPLPDGT